MVPGINSFVRLDANQQVAASTALADLGAGAFAFSFPVKAGKTVLLSAVLPFSVGSTGGFKFQLTADQTMQDHTSSWEAIDGVTAAPGSDVASVLTAQGSFANAWAVAGNHICRLDACLKGHATLDATVKIQFACNSAANAINVLKGAFMRTNQIN
jgi:hypothetical protein